MTEAKREEFSADLLKVYYDRLFPFDAMYEWLNYGSGEEGSCEEKDYFARREWSFTVGDDVYLRYQSFRNASEFRESVRQRQPVKIDIGAVFSLPPKDRALISNGNGSGGAVAEQRELVFDIDLTDYDDVRACCSGASLCARCWPLVGMAAQVLDRALREDLGFAQLLWVYSGRRGAHCWVADARARRLDNDRAPALAALRELRPGRAPRRHLLEHPLALRTAARPPAGVAKSGPAQTAFRRPHRAGRETGFARRQREILQAARHTAAIQQQQ